MNSKLISVIVPIYKVEKYLPKCIDSIIDQTYKNLEIILVDDGSPDGCPRICDEYAAREGRIKVIHQQNGGLSVARNSGLNIATGEFVAFVDSDDWLEPDMYETLLKISVEHDADISECDFRPTDGNIIAEKEKDEDVTTVYDSFPAIVDAIVRKTSNPKLAFEVWNKLYKRELIGDLRFKAGQIYEDLYFDRLLFHKCKKLVFTSHVGYNYRISRPGSTVTFFNEKKLCKFPELNDYIKDLEGIGRIDVANNIRLFGCGSAIDLYQSALKYKGGRKAKQSIHSYFIDYKSKLPSAPISYHIFSLSPSFYCWLRTLIVNSLI